MQDPKISIFSAIIWHFTQHIIAQDITQTIRGSIIDKDTQSPLIGCNVAVYRDSVLVTGGTSDEEGLYRIEDVPVGRYTIVASFLGYRQSVLPNIIVNSAKEVLLPIELEESVLTVDEFEAVRLKDFQEIDQEDAARKMNISQPTFHRLVTSARKKIADAIVNGKAIRVEGGNFRFN